MICGHLSLLYMLNLLNKLKIGNGNFMVIFFDLFFFGEIFHFRSRDRLQKEATGSIAPKGRTESR